MNPSQGEDYGYLAMTCCTHVHAGVRSLTSQNLVLFTNDEKIKNIVILSIPDIYTNFRMGPNDR